MNESIFCMVLSPVMRLLSFTNGSRPQKVAKTEVL